MTKFPNGFKTEPLAVLKPEKTTTLRQLSPKMERWLAIKLLANSISHRAMPSTCFVMAKWLDEMGKAAVTTNLGQLHVDFRHALDNALERAIKAEIALEKMEHELNSLKRRFACTDGMCEACNGGGIHGPLSVKDYKFTGKNRPKKGEVVIERCDECKAFIDDRLAATAVYRSVREVVSTDGFHHTLASDPNMDEAWRLRKADGNP